MQRNKVELKYKSATAIRYGWDSDVIHFRRYGSTLYSLKARMEKSDVMKRLKDIHNQPAHLRWVA